MCESGHDDGAERRHDHEVDNDRELQERQQGDDELLVAGKSPDALSNGFVPAAARVSVQTYRDR